MKSEPEPRNAVDLFAGEWLSRFPPPHHELTGGTVPLFQDARINWAAQRLGGFGGAEILELGPLEGGHSYMLEHLGAASVTAIEANRRAYMKCLITKELFQLQRVKFLLGDFMEYLRHSDQRFDVCVASGVLYHMQHPVELLSLIARHADRLVLWTHYYDRAVIEADSNRQRGHFRQRQASEFQGFAHDLYQQDYRAALQSPRFAGAGAPFSCWMSRDGILDGLRHLGFGSIEIGFEDRNHPHGPCFALVVSRVG